MAAGKWNMQKASGGVASITVADGVSNTAVVLPESGTVATEQYVDAKYSGFKNYIINGNFDVWQYGLSQTTTGYGSDDRWINFNTGSTKTHSRTITNKAEPFTAISYSTTVVSSVVGAGNACGKQQRIEWVNQLSGKTATLSFWAKANATKNISIDFVQYFGSGGTPSAIIEGISATKISITSSWVKYTITVNIPSIAGKSGGTDMNDSLWVRFWFDAGTDMNSRTASLGHQSGTFDIAQVQLEEGSVATPFEQRPYGLELSLCQRYYEVGGGVLLCSTSSGSFLGAVNNHDFRELKRISPSVTVTKISGPIAGIAANGASVNSISVSPSSQGTDGQFGYYVWTALAEL